MGKIVATIVGFVVLIVAFALLMAIPTMLAWNYVMPHLFKLPELSLLQAFALNVLANGLIKSSASVKAGS